MTSPVQASTRVALRRLTDMSLPRQDGVPTCNCAQLGHAGVTRTTHGQTELSGGDFVNSYKTTLHVLPILPLAVLLVYVIAWICWQFDRRTADQDAKSGVPAESAQSDES